MLIDKIQQEEILKLAVEIYKDLPFWKRYNIKKYILRNNWDVTGEWEKCLIIARRMIENKDYFLTK